MEDALFLALTAVIAAGVSSAVFMAWFGWFRREQRRREQRQMQRKILSAVSHTRREQNELFLTGRDAATYGELVAQFKVNHGKQVLSVLEADGKRFIHVDGELSALERAKMIRYLKSEGFMS